MVLSASWTIYGSAVSYSVVSAKENSTVLILWEAEYLALFNKSSNSSVVNNVLPLSKIFLVVSWNIP